jgi:CubicO group peptidase (beta-lactamase class C family)
LLTLSGTVAPGFEAVREAFARNFAQRDEIGAEVAVCHRGELVVDLIGGHKDEARTRPWDEDTVVLVYSVSKGMAAMAMALAHSRGLIDYEATVASYWPEFAQAGKEQITVRQLLAHQGGLSALDCALSPERIADRAWMAEVLAQQAPSWPPGTRQGYHGMTLGSYISQLISRVDPRGRALPQFFAEEIAGPLGVAFHLGLPADFAEDRIAPIKGFPLPELLLHMHELPWRLVAGLMWPWSLVTRSLMNPKVSNPDAFDSPAFRHLDFASAIGYGQARALARIYGDVVSEDSRIGIDRSTLDLLSGPVQEPSGGSLDLIWGTGTAWHLGFGRASELLGYPGEGCFGARGASGADAFADPDAQVGFAYTTNRCSLNAFGDPRVQTLVDAVYRCLGAQ